MAVSAASSSVPVCSIGTSFTGPTTETAVVLATAMGQTTLVPVPNDPGYPQALPGSRAPAHRFRVLATRGGTAMPSVGETFLAVPWAYDPACDLERFEQDVWVPEGAEVVFYFTPNSARRDNLEPIIDVLGWHSPYPYGEFLRFEDNSRHRAERVDWLSARDFFELLAQLPPADPSQSRAARLESIESLFRRRPPQWARQFPGAEILRRARQWAASGPSPIRAPTPNLR